MCNKAKIKIKENKPIKKPKFVKLCLLAVPLEICP
jgi:hypothetical protein